MCRYGRAGFAYDWLPKTIGWGAVGLALLPLVLPPRLMTIVFLLRLLVLSAGLLFEGIRTK